MGEKLGQCVPSPALQTMSSPDLSKGPALTGEILHIGVAKKQCALVNEKLQEEKIYLILLRFVDMIYDDLKKLCWYLLTSKWLLVKFLITEIKML